MNNINLSNIGVVYSNNICNICIEHFKENQIIIYTECNHLYHKKCIKDWEIKAVELEEFDNQQDKNNFIARCPTCRNTLTENMIETSVYKVKLVASDQIVVYQLNMCIEHMLSTNKLQSDNIATRLNDVEYLIEERKTNINTNELKNAILNTMNNYANNSMHSLRLVDKMLALVDRIDHTNLFYEHTYKVLSSLLDTIAPNIAYNIEFIEIFFKYNIITKQAITVMISRYISQKNFAKAEALIKNQNGCDCIDIDVLKEELLANISIDNQSNVKSIFNLINQINHKSKKDNKIQQMLHYLLDLIVVDESYNIEFIDIFFEYKIISKQALTTIMIFSLIEMDLYKAIDLQQRYDIDIDFKMLELVMLENIKSNNKYNIMQILHIICDINRKDVEHKKIQQMLYNVINKIVLDCKNLSIINILQKYLQDFKDHIKQNLNS